MKKCVSLVFLYAFCLVQNDAAKIKFTNPPGLLLLHIALHYLNISDVILTMHEDSSVPLDDHVKLLHKNYVFTSVFQWKNNISIEEQFVKFLNVIASRKHYTVIVFLDYESTNVFIKHSVTVREKLSLVCFYRWIMFDFDEVNVTQIQHPNSAAVCWRTIFVTMNENNESEDSLSLLGSTLQSDGHCALEEHLGDWSSSTGLTNTKPFQKHVMDFENRLFPGSVLDREPFYGKTKEGNLEGLEYELLMTLRQKLNFRVKRINNTDGHFGSRLPNGTWTGFIGLIASGKAIFSIATLSISNRRMAAVDFSAPYIFGKLSFVILSPALESRKLVLIKPLQKEVWAALGVTLIVCTFVLYLITHSLPCKSGVRSSYNIWFLLRTLGQQGTPSPAPSRYSIRFFISGWSFFVMVILWSYAGTLTSFMTYPGRRPAIDTIKKLKNALESDSIRYGTTKGTSYEHFLMTDMAEVHPIFEQSLLDHPESLVASVPQGMEMVLKGKYAFVYMKAILKWFAATLGYDRFRFSKNVFSTDAIGIALQKCHPLKWNFDRIVDRLEETGLFSKWYKDAFVRASIQAPQVDIKSVRALSLDDVQGAFYFLGISLLISTFVLFTEILTANVIFCRKRSKMKRMKRKRKVSFHKLGCPKYKQIKSLD